MSVKLFLDSGAFGAWRDGASIDLGKYMDYVRRNQASLWQYVNLDVIPTERTTAGLDDSAMRSYHNLQLMRSAGLDPLPVFHDGEDPRWLKQLLDDGHTYIGVATKEQGLDRQQRFLDRVFGLAGNVRVHGFGLTKAELLLRYPFASVDSSTWALSAGYGVVYVPVDGYSKPPLLVVTSDQWQTSPARQACRYDFLDPDMEAAVDSYFASLGLNIYALRHPAPRRHANLHYFKSLGEHLGITIVFATRVDAGQSAALSKLGAHTRLLSYWELRNHGETALRDYVSTGLIERKAETPRPKPWSTAYRNMRYLALARRINVIPQDREKVW